ncbi:MAG TPA: hypothetical protein EYQ08_06670 [Planctomycetes bacterium]|nr:hypothetical protein [Planctomycetota bacterium]
MWSLRTYGPIFLCLALLSGCASFEGERSGFFSGADTAAPDAGTDAKERSGFFSEADTAVTDAKERSGFYNGADRASRRQDWIRFRPDATSPFSGVEQPHAKPYSGQMSFVRGMYDLGAPDDVTEELQLGDIDGYGLWVSARPSEWYVAPELGFIDSTESNGALGKIHLSEFFAGGRVVAELPFTPFSVIAGMGISRVDGTIYDFDIDENGIYFHGGALLHIGDNTHLALDYRTVDYSDDIGQSNAPNVDVISVMLGVNW